MSHHEITAHPPQSDKGRKTLKSYVVGLFLCSILTLLSFGLVALHIDHYPRSHLMSNSTLFVSLVVLALLQLFVQAICFLRLNASKEGQSDLMSFFIYALCCHGAS